MTSQLQELSEMRNVHTMTFDFRAFGTKWRKRTTVLVGHVDSADLWALDTMRCLLAVTLFINARVHTEAESIR